MSRLQEECPDLTLVIVGGSDSEADAKPAIQAMAARYGISDRVLLVGPQPPTSLADWYGAADPFCLATLREGSANVLLEALACGLPCITTPVGGNPEIISSPDLGILVPSEAQAMAEAISSGLSQVWDRERIVAHTCTRTWEGVAAECHRYLSRLASAQTVRQA